MRAFRSSWLRRAAPVVVAAVLVSACQSRQTPPWMQDGRAPASAETDTQTAPAAGDWRPVTIAPIQPPPTPDATPPLAPLLGGPGRAVGPGAEAQPSPPPKRSSAVRVALLLPLSGANARLGAAMLNSAQMAMFSFADENFELLLQDTHGTPDGAAEAARLAIGDGAQLILGPLLAPSVRAVAPVARAANVPVIAFSSDRSVAGSGVYTLGFLPGVEVERVVGYTRSRGITRFAALVPDNGYGRAVTEAMRRVVDSSGGTVVEIVPYDPNTQDFTALVRRLADYERRRASLIAMRKELEKSDNEISRRALKRLERLQTVGDVPFEALLVADGGTRLQAIAALLPFYDIDPSRVRMLGTGLWDEPKVGAEPALVGGWFAAPPVEERAAFVKEYQGVYGSEPPRLATLAYDAMALAALLARSEGGPDFGPAALTQAGGFAGRDGIFRLRNEGVAERGLAVLQVHERSFRVVDPAPKTFERPTN